MNKSQCKTQMNTYLRKALNKYYYASGITQEKLVEKLEFPPELVRLCKTEKVAFLHSLF